MGRRFFERDEPMAHTFPTTANITFVDESGVALRFCWLHFHAANDIPLFCSFDYCCDNDESKD